MLNIEDTDLLFLPALASKNVRANNAQRHTPAEHLKKVFAARGIYFLHEPISNLVKIGPTSNVAAMLKYLRSQHKRDFVSLCSISLPHQFVVAFRLLLSDECYRSCYYWRTDRLYALVTYMTEHQQAIERRCADLFASYISRNDYFDFERAVIWMLNPTSTFPLPAGEMPKLNLRDAL